MHANYQVLYIKKSFFFFTTTVHFWAKSWIDKKKSFMDVEIKHREIAKSCHEKSHQFLSQFEFCEFCHNLSFVTIWVFEFCHNLSFWVLSQINFFSFVTIWVFELSKFWFLSFVTIWVLEFCHYFSCQVVTL